MKNCVLKLAISMVAILAMGSAASAGLLNLPLEAADFNSLLGGAAVAVGSPTTTVITGGNMVGEVVSQAFTDGNGNYAYLYQVNNTGSSANSVIESFTVSPINGANSGTILGNVTGDDPFGFTDPGVLTQMPAGAAIDPASGPTVSFGFPGPYQPPYTSYAIEPGYQSPTLYVLSQSPPGIVTGNVIDGVAYSGPVVGAVPEPGTLALLGVGAAGLLGLGLRRRRAARRTANSEAFDRPQEDVPAILAFPSRSTHLPDVARRAA